MQHRSVLLFLLSFLLFCSHRGQTLRFEGESPGGKSLRKSENSEAILPFSCCPLVFSPHEEQPKKALTEEQPKKALTEHPLGSRAPFRSTSLNTPISQSTLRSTLQSTFQGVPLQHCCSRLGLCGDPLEGSAGALQFLCVGGR